jgi:hypothetical protein
MLISNGRWYRAASYAAKNWKQFRSVGNASAKALVDTGLVIVKEGQNTNLEEAMSATLAIGAGLKRAVFRLQGVLAGAGITYLVLKPKKEKSE